MVSGYHLHHEVPLAGEQGELRPETGGMAGIQNLPVQDEIMVEDGKGLLPQISHRDGVPLRQRVALMKQGYVPLGGEVPPFHGGGEPVGIQGHPQIHLAPRYFFVNSVGAVLHDLNVDIGIGRRKARQEVPEKAGSEQRGQSQGESTLRVAVHDPDPLHRLLVGLHEPPGPLHQPEALVRQPLLPAEGVEQLDPQLLLQLLHRYRQRGLRDRQILRRLGKALFLRNSQKIRDLFDVHNDTFPMLVFFIIIAYKYLKFQCMRAFVRKSIVSQGHLINRYEALKYHHWFIHPPQFANPLF